MPTKYKQSGFHSENENVNNKEKGPENLSVPDPMYDEAKEGNCGYGSCEPKWLQVFNNPKGFIVFYCCVVIVQGILINGIFTVSISSLEKRFGFQSSETGFVSICYDIGFCVVTFFVSYYGSRLHRPRCIGIGAILLGFGALLSAIPHFTTPTYQYSDELDSIDGTCSDDEIDCQTTTNEPTGFRYYIWVFVFAQLLCGAGGSLLFSIGFSFIEDTVSKHSASVYLGIGNSAAVLGPIFGYLLGGYLLRFYIDFDSVDSSQVKLTPADPRWVGAWWLGFIICAICSFVVAIPLLAFPKQIPGTARNRAMRDSEVPVDGGEEVARKKDFGRSLKDVPAAILILLKNPSYVFIVLSAISSTFIVNGFATFLPKIVENEFHQTASYAAFVTGTVAFPAGFLGSLVGGILVNRFKWNITSIFKFCLVTYFFVMVLRANIFLACKNRDMAGITIPYIDQDSYNGSLWAPCNSNCVCQQEYYIPVCGADDINYFTACHAGCSNSQDMNETTFFFNCSCIKITSDEGWKAKKGNCPSDCNTLSYFLVLFFFTTFFVFLSSTPTIVAMFRIVPLNLRPFALGIQILVARILGSIPGPIAYGVMFDLTCVVWQTRQCDGSRGSCWIYDNQKFALYLFAILAGGGIIGAVFYVCGLCFYKPPPEGDLDMNQGKGEMVETSSKNMVNLPPPSEQSLNNVSSLNVATCSIKLKSGAVITKL